MINPTATVDPRDQILTDRIAAAEVAADQAYSEGREGEAAAIDAQLVALDRENETRLEKAVAELRTFAQEIQAAAEDNAGSSWADVAQSTCLWNQRPDAIRCCEYWELALASAQTLAESGEYA